MSHAHALLAIIGGGNMGKAIILGALDAKLLAPGEIVVCETDASKRAAMKGWGVQVVSDHGEAMARLLPAPRDLMQTGDSTALAACGGQVLLAVKPQSLAEVAAQLRPHLASMPRVVISILAGMPTSRIADALGNAVLRGGACAKQDGVVGSKGEEERTSSTSLGSSSPSPHLPHAAFLPVVRVMPNTPARLRKGMAAMCLGEHTTKAHAALAYDLFASVGEVAKIDESLMDAFTALSGSGPAYLFYLAEAMIDAAHEVGFDRITADRVVRQTLLGAAALLGDSSEPPAALRAAVTSKGGTTEAACAALDQRAVKEAVVAAIVAGRDRGQALAAGMAQ